jgi:hypothetical protein
MLLAGSDTTSVRRFNMLNRGVHGAPLAQAGASGDAFTYATDRGDTNELHAQQAPTRSKKATDRLRARRMRRLSRSLAALVFPPPFGAVSGQCTDYGLQT